ncbi:MAG: hypothetical protein ACRDJH_10215 [Thermomicrobiales bacterium]
MHQRIVPYLTGSPRPWAAASILGVYPPDERTLREYDEWRKRSVPSDS